MTFQNYNTKNDAISTLLAWISASTESVQVQSGDWAKFPASNFPATIIQYTSKNDRTSDVVKKEKVLVSGNSTDIFTITRGFGGDTPTAFETGDTIVLNVVSEVIEDIQDEVTDLWSRITTAEWDITALENDKSDKTNVLELDNTTPYTPTADYHPATKKFVEDQGLNIDWIETSTNIPETSKFAFYNTDNTRNESATTEELRQELESIQYIWVTASDTLQASADTERYQNVADELDKKKEIKIWESYTKLSTVRVKVEARANARLYATSRRVQLYKNWVFVDYFNPWDLNWTYTEYSLDLPVNGGDLIQVYLEWSSGVVFYIRNFRIYYDEVGYTKTTTININ